MSRRYFEVCQYDIRETVSPVTRPEAFAVRKDRPAVWLQRARVWILRKLAAYAVDSVTTYHRVEIDRDSVLERLYEQFMVEVNHNAQHGAPTTFLVGAQDFSEMRDEYMRTEMWRYPGVIDLRASRDEWRPYGMRAIVIPRMKGIVVLPAGYRVVRD